MKIRAAVARAPDLPFEIISCDLVEPGPGEVLVKMVSCGICHLDIAVKAQHSPPTLPRILGHEGAGVVERVGPGVTNLICGDHVLLSYGSCGECSSCVSGAPAYCAHTFAINFLGERGRADTHSVGGVPIPAGFFAQSSFATHAIATTRNVVKVDRDLPLSTLAPLGCGFQTGMGSVINVLKPRAGDMIAVFGCGAVGMAAIIAARIVGCSVIVAVDTNERRLALAREMGATHSINGALEDASAQIAGIAGVGTHFAFDTTGVPAVADQALRALAPRGTAAFVAPSRRGTSFSFEARAIISSGRAIRGVLQGDAISSEFIPRMIEFYRSGQLPLERLITTFRLEEINRAVRELESGDVLKAVLLMD
jgi:aryl-alcohol dehydrogenase